MTTYEKVFSADTTALSKKIESHEAKIGVVGLGYVGLPLVMAFCDKGFPVTGFDIDQKKIDKLLEGKSYIKHIPSEGVEKIIKSDSFVPTVDFSLVKDMDVVIICVPTPLSKNRAPDLKYIENTAESLYPHMKKGQLIVLESTVYPGTTKEVMTPILEKSGLKGGADFHVAFSPEREDPGNKDFSTTTIPKVVGADSEEAQFVAKALYSEVVDTVVPVSSTATAEAVKLMENIFRSVNIALVNEIKVIYSMMDIDVWEVIDAAATKPFGFMPFYPGPGLGGHCIPIDPFYLTWKARESDIPTKFIELAGEINSAMPMHTVRVLLDALNDHLGKALKGSRILVVGAAYKKNIDDMRESPSMRIMDLLVQKGADLNYYDPYVPELIENRIQPKLAGLKSIDWNKETLNGFDAALICTDHDDVDWDELVAEVPLVVDTRNATKNVIKNRDKIVKA